MTLKCELRSPSQRPVPLTGPFGKEIQRYLFTIGPVDLADGTLLSEMVNFFEEPRVAQK